MPNTFLSNPFCSRPFASNVFTGLKVVAPAAVPAGAMTSLGGGSLTPVDKIYVNETEEEFNQYVLRRSLGGKAARRKSVEFARGVGEKIAKEVQEASDSVRVRDRKKSAGRVEKLRRKLGKYKGEISKLHKKLASRDSEFKDQLDEMRATVKRLEAVVATLKRALEVSPVAVRHRQEKAAAKEEFVPPEVLEGEAARALEQALLKRSAALGEQKAVDAGLSAEAYLAMALGAFVLTSIVPEDLQGVRTVGYAASVALGVAGISKAVGSETVNV